MNTKTKLVSVFLVIAAFSALVEIINLNVALSTHRKFTKITEKTIPKLLEMERSKNSSLRLMAEAYSSALLKGESAHVNDDSVELKEADIEEESEWLAAGETLEKSLMELSHLSDNAENKYLYQQLIILCERLEESSKEIMELRHSGNADQNVLSKQKDFEELEETFLSNIQRLIGLELKQLQIETQLAKRSAVVFFVVNIISTLIVIFLSMLLGKKLVESIAQPLVKLKETATKIGAGCQENRGQLDSNDELSFLGNSLNIMDRELKKTNICKSYLDQAIDSLSEALIIIDKYKIITTVNAAATTLTGYSKEELIGQSVRLLFPKKETLEYLRCCQGKGTNNNRRETNLTTKEREDIAVFLKAAPLKTNSENSHEIVCLLQDISERKKYEKKLVTALQATLKAVEGKSRPLTNVSHEIRAATNEVLGKTELLSTTDLNAEQANYVTTLKESGENLLTLINELIDLSKQEAEKMSLVKSEWKKYIDTN